MKLYIENEPAIQKELASTFGKLEEIVLLKDIQQAIIKAEKSWPKCYYKNAVVCVCPQFSLCASYKYSKEYGYVHLSYNGKKWYIKKVARCTLFAGSSTTPMCTIFPKSIQAKIMAKIMAEKNIKFSDV
jgi:hypothetical protein